VLKKANFDNDDESIDRTSSLISKSDHSNSVVSFKRFESIDNK
jgi:hypothetical protein